MEVRYCRAKCLGAGRGDSGLTNNIGNPDEVGKRAPTGKGDGTGECRMDHNKWPVNLAPGQASTIMPAGSVNFFSFGVVQHGDAKKTSQ